jgi:hypothetical protein
MKIPRRRFLHLAAGAAALPAVSGVTWAQAYPTKPVRIVGGFTAGSANDIVARLIGQWLSERLGQRFIVEPRPGAGGSVASGRRQYDRRAMCGRECIRHDDEAASRLAPKGRDGRFDLYVAVNGRDGWRDLE